MQFPERIKKIPPEGKVLEVGPGGHPYPRSNVLLEREYVNEEEARAQRGLQPPPKTGQRIVYYSGPKFPFADKEFDYVICSHVLEHVEDVDEFAAELSRVARMGYLEFPTVFYDHLYNFPVHIALLFWNEREKTLYWLPKKAVEFDRFKPIHTFFYETMLAGTEEQNWHLKFLFFQGFEYVAPIKTKRARSLEEMLASGWKDLLPKRTYWYLFNELITFNIGQIKQLIRLLLQRGNR